MDSWTPLTRPSDNDLDNILGYSRPVLHSGFVQLLDYMGTEQSIVNAARISYGAGTRKVSDDTALLRYLMLHAHTSPFEQVEMQFRVRVPMDIWRQWVRHRTANINEYSTRYSEAIDDRHVTLPGEWRAQSSNNKQGSGEFLDPGIGEQLSYDESRLHELATTVYEHRLRHGVAREQARKDLPLSTYTEAVWKCDLHNLLHFLSLRMDPHAQLEIREFANAIAYFVEIGYPRVWQAFMDYHHRSPNTVLLTAPDIEVMSLMSCPDICLENPEQMLEQIKVHLPHITYTKREAEALIAKIERIMGGA